ncbi:chloramphenicol phosphotransferase CPT family protein [Fodinicola feengrottensis]|uniref:Chloramphenicol phosphotransferase CPT family protein n=1 Tax=Fodinicola feengrottensis TaxID=435914 RepID=A0ABN2I2Z7_9ACTN|nr:AAA family ATPase [Fodinicola feengrottensis]
MPTIVFLNGPSSAGKTSLGRALQNQLDEPYLLLGLDTCFAMVPEKWAGGPVGPYRHLGIHYQDLPDQDGCSVRGIGYGEAGWTMLSGFHLAVAALVEAGNNVIVDEMLLDGRVRDHWLGVLAPMRTLFVRVDCALPELERRERLRGNPPGLSRWSYERVHDGMRYDATIDTTHQLPTEAATGLLRSGTVVPGS